MNRLQAQITIQTKPAIKQEKLREKKLAENQQPKTKPTTRLRKKRKKKKQPT